MKEKNTLKIGYPTYVLLVLIDLGSRIVYREIDVFQIISSLLIFSIPIITLAFHHLLKNTSFSEQGKTQFLEGLDTFLFFSFPLVYARYILERQKALSWQIILFGILLGLFSVLIFNGLNVLLKKTFKNS